MFLFFLFLSPLIDRNVNRRNKVERKKSYYLYLAWNKKVFGYVVPKPFLVVPENVTEAMAAIVACNVQFVHKEIFFTEQVVQPWSK